MAFIDQHFAPLTRTLTGRVLELGCGRERTTAIDLTNAHLTAVDRSADAVRAAYRREPPGHADAVAFVTASGEALPFPDRAFDAIIGAFVFCSVGDVDHVAAELARVAKPDAPIVFAEHVRSDRLAAGWLQDVVTPAYARLFHHCHLNRYPLDALRRNGFEAREVARQGQFLPWTVIFGTRAI